MNSNKRYHVYEVLTRRQLERIFSPDVIKELNATQCRMVAMGITEDMKADWTGKRRYIVQEVAR